MTNAFRFLLPLFCTVVCLRAANISLPRSAPEAQGVSSTALLSFVQALNGIDGMHSVMVLRHGHVIAEGWWAPYDAQHNHILYSLSKSFTSTAVGLAVGDGKLSIDDEVLKFFPEEAPTNVSNNLKAMRVRDLLTMSTGHQDEPPTGPDVVSAKSFLAHPVPHLPGTHFKYNTAATFMQSAIVQKVAGETVLDYLKPRLFAPLGIEHPIWDANFQGISLGGYGLRVRTEDIAKFGQLYLQRGKWNGKQLVPAAWIDAASAKQTSNGSNPKSDWNQGYGFQFWRCRHNAFRGDGAFGQYCVVLPDQDVVIAITSGIKDMQAVLNLIWDKLLPEFRGEKLRANSGTAKQLSEFCARLEVPPAEGAPKPSAAGKYFNRKFNFGTNDGRIESLSLVEQGKKLLLQAHINGRDVTIPCGYREWQKGHAPLMAGRLAQFPDEPTAGSYAWLDDDTCLVKLCAFETPYHTLLKLRFRGNELTLDSETNVGFGPTKRPPLTGRAE